MKLNSDQLFAEALTAHASDIHIDPLTDGFAIRLRIDGSLHHRHHLNHEHGTHLTNQFKAQFGIDPSVTFAPRTSRHSMSYHDQELDVRLTLVPCISGEKIALRLLDPNRIKHRLGDLGLASDDASKIGAWLESLNGMFVVSGPTSSGKTTTLYALLHELATTNKHILTIEDPAEYEIDGINQIQVDSRHDLDFAEALKTMLRLDPDCLMLGEMRDREAVEVAARAASSGHILLSTIHARDAVSTITSLRNFGMGGNQIAVTIAAIINQRLVRKLCQHCREPVSLQNEEANWLHERGIDSTSSTAYTARGCNQCAGIGFAGRTGIFEAWYLDSEDYDLLLTGADEKRIRKKLLAQGQRRLIDDGWLKIRNGITSLSEVRHATGAARADDWQLPT